MAGGLAAQSVNVFQGIRLPPSRLLPDPLQREAQRVPLATRLPGTLCSSDCNGWARRTAVNNAGFARIARAGGLRNGHPGTLGARPSGWLPESFRSISSDRL